MARAACAVRSVSRGPDGQRFLLNGVGDNDVAIAVPAITFVAKAWPVAALPTRIATVAPLTATSLVTCGGTAGPV